MTRTLALLVVGLLGFAPVAAGRDVVVVLDRSRSVTADGRDPGATLVRLWAACAPDRGRVLLVTTDQPASRPLPAELPAATSGTSDLLTALEALARVPDLDPRATVVLVSDGEVDVVAPGRPLPAGLVPPPGRRDRVAVNRAARDLLVRRLAPLGPRLMFVELPLDPAARFAPLGEALPASAGNARVDPDDLLPALQAMLAATDPGLVAQLAPGGAAPLLPGVRWVRVVAPAAAPAVEGATIEADVDGYRVASLAALPQGGVELGGASLVVQRVGLTLGADAWFVEAAAVGGVTGEVRARLELLDGRRRLAQDAFPPGLRLTFALSAEGGKVDREGRALAVASRRDAPGERVVHEALLHVPRPGGGSVAFTLAEAEGLAAARFRVPLRSAAAPVAGQPLDVVAGLPAGRAWVRGTSLVLAGGPGETTIPLERHEDGLLHGHHAAGLPRGAYRIHPRSGAEVGLTFELEGGPGAALAVGTGARVVVRSARPLEVRLKAGAPGAARTGEAPLDVAVEGLEAPVTLRCATPPGVALRLTSAGLAAEAGPDVSLPLDLDATLEAPEATPEPLRVRLLPPPRLALAGAPGPRTLRFRRDGARFVASLPLAVEVQGHDGAPPPLGAATDRPELTAEVSAAGLELATSTPPAASTPVVVTLSAPGCSGATIEVLLEPPPRVVVRDAPAGVTLAGGEGRLTLVVALEPPVEPAPLATLAAPGLAATFDGPAPALGSPRPATVVLRATGAPPGTARLELGADGALPALVDLSLSSSPAPAAALALPVPPEPTTSPALAALAVGLLLLLLLLVAWALRRPAPPALGARQLRRLAADGQLAAGVAPVRLADHVTIGPELVVPLDGERLALRVEDDGGVCGLPASTVRRLDDAGRAHDLPPGGERLRHGDVLSVGDAVWVFLERDPGPADPIAWLRVEAPGDDEVVVLTGFDDEPPPAPAADSDDIVVLTDDEPGQAGEEPPRG